MLRVMKEVCGEARYGDKRGKLTIPAHGKMRQEDSHEFKDSLCTQCISSQSELQSKTLSQANKPISKQKQTKKFQGMVQ